MAKRKTKKLPAKNFPTVKLEIPRPLYTVPEACHMLCCGVTKLYELIGDGRLDTRRLGDRRLITARSINNLIDALPRA